MSFSPSQTSPRRAPTASREKHYRAKSITRSSLDLDNSETGALLLAPNGLAAEAEDATGYPPQSATSGPSGVSLRSWSTRRMPLGSRRLALILFGFVALVVLFGRRDSRDAVVSYVNDKAGQGGTGLSERAVESQAGSRGQSCGRLPSTIACLDDTRKAPVTGTKSDTVRQNPHCTPTPPNNTMRRHWQTTPRSQGQPETVGAIRTYDRCW